MINSLSVLYLLIVVILAVPSVDAVGFWTLLSDIFFLILFLRKEKGHSRHEPLLHL